MRVLCQNRLRGADVRAGTFIVFPRPVRELYNRDAKMDVAGTLGARCRFGDFAFLRTAHSLQRSRRSRANKARVRSKLPCGRSNRRQRVTAYTLPPDLYQKAKTLGRIHFALNLVGFFYGILVLWLVLRWKLAAKYRDWAERVSANRFVQAFVFTPALILMIAVLESPTAIYEHIVSRRYGLSVEGWGALAWDWAKGIFLFMVIGSILVWILYGVIRRSPRRWWFYFWLISVPMIVFFRLSNRLCWSRCFSPLRRCSRRIRRW